MPSTRTGGTDAAVAERVGGDRVGHRGAGAAVADSVFDGEHQRMAGGVGDHPRIERLDRPDVPHRHRDAGGLERLGGAVGGVEHLADGQDADVRTGPDLAGVQAADPPRRPGTLRAAVFGHRIATGPSTMSSASRSICPSSWYDDGARIVMPGTFDSSAMSSTP